MILMLPSSQTDLQAYWCERTLFNSFDLSGAWCKVWSCYPSHCECFLHSKDKALTQLCLSQQKRILTVRKCARAQGMPDEYGFISLENHPRRIVEDVRQPWDLSQTLSDIPSCCCSNFDKLAMPSQFHWPWHLEGVWRLQWWRRPRKKMNGKCGNTALKPDGGFASSWFSWTRSE